MYADLTVPRGSSARGEFWCKSLSFHLRDLNFRDTPPHSNENEMCEKCNWKRQKDLVVRTSLPVFTVYRPVQLRHKKLLIYGTDILLCSCCTLATAITNGCLQIYVPLTKPNFLLHPGDQLSWDVSMAQVLQTCSFIGKVTGKKRWWCKIHMLPLLQRILLHLEFWVIAAARWWYWHCPRGPARKSFCATENGTYWER